MRDRSREFCDHCDSRSLIQLRPGLVQALFGLLAFVDIDGKAVPLNDFPFGIAERLAHHVVRSEFTIGSSQPMDGAEGFSGLHRSKKRFRGFFKVVRMHEILPSKVGEILQCPSAVFAQSAADVHGLARGRGSPKHRGHGIDDMKELMFAQMKGAFGAFERVDVRVDAIPPDDIAAVIPMRVRSYEVPMVFAVIREDSIRVFIRYSHVRS